MWHRSIRLSAIPHRPDLYEADLGMPGLNPLLSLRLESSLRLLKQGVDAELSRFDAIHSIRRSVRIPWRVHGLSLQRGREGY